ncbi:winged helix-turn-helix transcriptional regulator [Bacillus massiliigorillae]|uniref:winged helix-turn-helix transcriptional regulator n=1 Tax=Bacillus massiliigorillae TaxID=1243664 RepID=UPI0003A0BA0F|nr:helix-turn-helix domain-containing protein [Bacillus massiliigorillae]
MYEPKIKKEMMCPIEYAIELCGGKWKTRIICLITSNGTMRYNAIRKELSNVTDTVLTSTLKELIAEGIVSRKQYNQMPPKVEYILTEKGESLKPILHGICQWSRTYTEFDKENALSPCKSCKEFVS